MCKFNCESCGKCSVHIVSSSIYTSKNSNRHATTDYVEIVRMSNGAKGVKNLDLVTEKPHVTNGGNDKTGPHVQSTSMSIIHTCDHNAPCYKQGLCYGCGGCFNFGCNALDYAETTKAALRWEAEKFAEAILRQIKKSTTMFRWFVVGDIPSEKVLYAMVLVAKALPNVKFWAYTKKYAICNKWVREHGGSIASAIPSNLHILFSEWEDEEFKMDNPYGFAISRYIPLGMEEELVPTCTHICPCSDENWDGTCEECGICANILPGEVVGLKEHSTKATKERDKKVHAGQKKARAAKKAKKA